jgi:DNA-nicking Smr family endonuclease
MSKKTDDDSQLFRESVSGVRRLPACDKTSIQREKLHGDRQYRQQKAQMQQPSLTTSLSIKDNVSAEDILAYCQTGLSKQQYQCLKNGQLTISAELDLHGYTVEQALLALESFFNHARENQFRCLRIIHGKGSEKALLKNTTLAFLQAQSTILAYHSAPARLGGTGATLILLKR